MHVTPGLDAGVNAVFADRHDFGSHNKIFSLLKLLSKPASR